MCMITAYQLSPPITTKATINIIHNKRIIRSSVFDIGATGSHKLSLNIPFTNLKLSQSGEYICSYIRSNNSFVQPSNVKSTATELNIKSEFHYKVKFFMFNIIMYNTQHYHIIITNIHLLL